MRSLPPKSRLRHLTHNPTGELIWVITKAIKKIKNKSYESKSRKNPSKLDRI
jgi:hypothetical protein